MNTQDYKKHTRINLLDDAIDATVEEILEIFSLHGIGKGHSGDYNYKISSEGTVLHNTPYCYGDQKLLHFTSLNNLCEILNSNSLRMYSLYNCNDRLELEYWKSIFTEEDYDFYKEHHILSTSFTKPDKYNDLLMWRLYGDNGNGVCVELEIINEKNEWKNFTLAPVNYRNGVELFQKYYQKISNLNEKYNSNVKIDLSPIIPFFKSSDWQHEHEVRMVYYKDDPFDDHSIQRLQTMKDQKIVNYIPFPLNHHSKHMEFNKIDKSIPKLKISKIYTGFKSNDDRFMILQKILRNYCTLILKDSSLVIPLEALNINSKIR